MNDTPALRIPHPPLILTINGGSSSIKFALFEGGDPPRRILAGGIERIGRLEAVLRAKGVSQADRFSRFVTAPDHTAAVNVLMDWIGAVAAALGGLDTLVFAIHEEGPAGRQGGN